MDDKRKPDSRGSRKVSSASFKKASENPNRGTVEALINVAMTAEARGEYKIAITLFQKLIVEPKHNLTLEQILKFTRLASSSCRHMKNPDRALRFAEKYVAVGQDMRDLDEYPPKSKYPDMSEEEFQASRLAIKARESVNAMEELIFVHIDLKNYDLALGIINECLKMLENLNIKDCQEYGVMLFLLGILNSRQEKYTEALLECNKAKIILSEYKKDSEYLAVLNEMALCHLKLNQFNEMFVLYKEAVDSHRNIYGDKNPEYAIPLSNLAVFYSSLKQYERAAPLYEETLSLCQEAFGDKNYRTIAAAQGLNLTRKNIENPHRELIDSTHSFRMCNTCEKIVEGMEICPACCKVWYCNAECQLKDWSNHKPSCHVCIQCDTPIDRDFKILRCSTCKKAKYCDVECQKKHWKEHKPACMNTK